MYRLGRQTPRADLVGGRDVRRSRDSVIDQMDVGAAVFLFEDVLDHGGDDDHLVRPSGRKAFASTQDEPSQSSPFPPVVVRAVVSGHDLQSEQLGQRDGNAGADGLNMDQVGLGAIGIPDAAEGVHGSLKAAPSGGIEVFELDALIGGVGGRLLDERFATRYGDVAP